jgi:hypothetical protein
MAKKEKVVEESVVVEQASQSVELNDVAFSIVKDVETLHYSIVRITFDLKSHTAGKVEVVEMAETRDEANERFKVHVAKAKLLG